MKTSKDLLLAILAMDSYNQGYGWGINHDKNQIGAATKSIESDTEETAKTSATAAAGFYAVSYTLDAAVGTMAAGTKIISYRGTYKTSDDPIVKGANDILTGWIAGVGVQTEQTELARQFYESVTGKSVFAGKADNTILTGHSLGGALAGFV